MSADRELLEMAAKAAGYSVRWVDQFDAGLMDTHMVPLPPERQHFCFAEFPYKEWNPPTDDGDALRLAVKLGMLFNYMHERFEALQRFYREELDKDIRPSEAARRAIVRVAAAIGKAMP